jgi:ribosomal protein S18 acetylase RimI-like enzyme
MICVANVSDLSGIRTLMKSVVGFWDETWRSDVLERALGSAETIALVYLNGDRIDGFVCAHDVGFRAYLSELVVSPSAQGAGIGGGLLSEVERRLRERGCSLAIADVWHNAEGFYRAHGWTPPPVVLVRKRLAGGGIEPTATER